jgi:hypothetical protein
MNMKTLALPTLAGAFLAFAVSSPARVPLKAEGSRASQSLQSASAPANRGAQAKSAGPTITYRKVFKSSYPEFVEIKVNESGSGTFDIRQLDEQPNPQPFQMGLPMAQKIFELSARLNYFQGENLDVHHRLANLGQKTFRYENGSQKYETTFNYTLEPDATQLLTIFEGITRQEGDLSDLKRAMQYDRLGVNDVLVQIETDYNNKLLPDPSLLLPTLDQLAGDEQYLAIARQRARTLASHIRGGH